MKQENNVRPRPSIDPVLQGFLEHEYRKGMKLARESGLLDLVPLTSPPYCRVYVAHFKCKGLVKKHNGNIIEANEFKVSILFPLDYLRRVNPFEIVTWLVPANIFHPNIRPPFICLGRITPGMGLTEILHQIADIISYRNVNMNESDSLNKEACGFSRKNIHRFPIDDRQMKRNKLNVQVGPAMEKE